MSELRHRFVPGLGVEIDGIEQSSVQVKDGGFGHSLSSGAGLPNFCVPFGVERVLGHVPVEVRRAVFPPYRTAFAERPLYLVDCLVRGSLGLEIGALLGVSDRPTGRHQPTDKVVPLRFVETRVRHAPEPAADDEVAAVRRDGMLHNAA